MSPEVDKTYDRASMAAFGRNVGEMFMGMVASGMEREEALEAVKAWLTAMALRPNDPKEPPND